MVRGVNKVILVGNLGKEPEVRYLPNGGAVANATIAKLRDLTYPDQVALVEDIETFWRGVANAGPDGED